MSVKSILRSDVEATTPGLGDKPNQVQNNEPAMIEALFTETVECTKQGMEGEIFSLEAMFPARNNDLDNEDPFIIFKASTSDPDHTIYICTKQCVNRIGITSLPQWTRR
jgi:hypothetical protein